jgi:uncharacterized LabA/DUF88 family protein
MKTTTPFLDGDLNTAVLIDGINTYYVFKNLGWSPDYKKLLDFFKRNSILRKLYYFVSLDTEQEDNSLVKLIDWLDFNGYQTKVVESEDRRRGIEVDFTIEALKLVSTVDHFVLFTGNGQFVPLVRALDNLGKSVTIASTLYGQRMVSDSLRRVSDSFLELNSLREFIEKIDEKEKAA